MALMRQEVVFNRMYNVIDPMGNHTTRSGLELTDNETLKIGGMIKLFLTSTMINWSAFYQLLIGSHWF